MLAELIKSFLPRPNKYHDPKYWIALFKAKVGGKYLKRWQVTNPRTGKKSWKYKYKPLSQRGAHEITLGKFKKVTKIADETHKAAVEKALQEGHSISMHILKDYPDLITKYNKSAKVAKFDQLKNKVKDAISKRVKPEPVKESDKPASEPVKETPKTEPAKPKSSNPELDKARSELNPKQKWISLKAILDKAQKSGTVPDGLEAEVKQAGKDYVSHVMGGDWTGKSPKKEIGDDIPEPKKEPQFSAEVKKTQAEQIGVLEKSINKLKSAVSTRESEVNNPKFSNIKQKLADDLVMYNGRLQNAIQLREYISDAKNVIGITDETDYSDPFMKFVINRDLSINDYENMKSELKTESEQKQSEIKKQKEADEFTERLVKENSVKFGRAIFIYEKKWGTDYFKIKFPYNESDIENVKRIKGAYYSVNNGEPTWGIPKEGIKNVLDIFSNDAYEMSQSEKKDYYDSKYNKQRYYDRGGKY